MMQRFLRPRSATPLGLVLVLTSSACDNSPPPIAPTGLDSATAERLFERLDRLAEALEASSARPRQAAVLPTAEPGERIVVTSETKELAARLEALEQAVLALQARGPLGAASSGRRAVAPPPMLEASVRQVVAQLREDNEALQREVRRGLFMLTEQDMLDRFGTPSWVNILQTGNLQWGYTADDSSFSVTFVNNRVAVIEN